MSDGIIVHPATGEILNLDADTADLARWLVEARELDEAMRAEKKRVVTELLARMDREATYTLRTKNLEIKGDGPEPPYEYDAQPLRQALTEYVNAEVISQDALDRAVEIIPTYKPRVNGLKALARQGGDLAKVIEAHRHMKQNHDRRVSVKPRTA